MQTVYLADHPNLLYQLSEYLHHEFSYLTPSRTVEQILEKMTLHCNRDVLPLTLLLLEGANLIGSVSLRQHDLNSHLELTPWLASLFIAPAYRNRGLGELLMQAAIAKAKSMRFPTLYLFTPNKTAFYQKRGWRAIEHTEFNGHPSDIMQFSIALEPS